MKKCRSLREQRDLKVKVFRFSLSEQNNGQVEVLVN